MLAETEEGEDWCSSAGSRRGVYRVWGAEEGRWGGGDGREVDYLIIGSEEAGWVGLGRGGIGGDGVWSDGSCCGGRTGTRHCTRLPSRAMLRTRLP
eukprot:798571-Rhodomonas_salina.1